MLLSTQDGTRCCCVGILIPFAGDIVCVMSILFIHQLTTTISHSSLAFSSIAFKLFLTYVHVYIFTVIAGKILRLESV